MKMIKTHLCIFMQQEKKSTKLNQDLLWSHQTSSMFHMLEITFACESVCCVAVELVQDVKTRQSWKLNKEAEKEEVRKQT